jgi:hypothetical protein
MRRLASCVAVTALAILPLLPRPASGADMAAHAAEYDLHLQSSHGGEIISGSGHMSYEVTDACEGWATRQRLLMDLTNSGGQDVHMVFDYTTYESKDGLRLRFHMKQTTEDAVTSEVAGDAEIERPGGPGTVRYTMPEKIEKPLPAGTLFPTTHTDTIIEGAKAGKRFLALPLFDGTSANGPANSTVVINGWNTPAATKWAPLSAHPSGRVRIAFFDASQASQEPDYEVSLRYFDNGIADNLSMDFGDFVMGGTLVSLNLPKPGC